MVERRLRLREEADVRRVRARGRAWADGPLVARVLPRPVLAVPTTGDDHAPPVPANRYAVVAGKRVGKSVQRNRLKRLVREAIRHLHPRLAPGHDVVVVVRGTVEEMPGYDAAYASLERIATRAGLLTRSEDPGPRAEQPRAAAQAGARAQT